VIDRTTIAWIMVIGVLGVCRAGAASAQPRWGRERIPQAGVCFYEDSDFRGRYFCVKPGERLLLLPAGMGDRISSLRVVGSTQVTVYRDSVLRGRSARFMGDVRNLKTEGWSDRISSMEVRREAGVWRATRPPVWGHESLPREGACFYREKDFRGPYFCAPRGATYTVLPSGFNDHISSIRVFGGEVRIFEDHSFRGRSAEIRADTRDLRDNWRNTASSVRVF
jgi:hypothetical protein